MSPEEIEAALTSPTRQRLQAIGREIAEDGLFEELGALRIALLTVMESETDALKLVTGVARCTAVAYQALRVHRVVHAQDLNDRDGELAGLFNEVLAEMGEQGAN